MPRRLWSTLENKVITESTAVDQVNNQCPMALSEGYPQGGDLTVQESCVDHSSSSLITTKPLRVFGSGTESYNNLLNKEIHSDVMCIPCASKMLIIHVPKHISSWKTSWICMIDCFHGLHWHSYAQSDLFAVVLISFGFKKMYNPVHRTNYALHTSVSFSEKKYCLFDHY